MSQLYLIELFVEELALADDIAKEAGKEAVFVVKIKMIDLPSIEIYHTDAGFPSSEIETVRNHHRLKLRAGQAFHVARRPLQLAERMAKQPLSIGLFRHGDSFPLCMARVPLSGCLCDQLNVSDAEIIDPPEPYVFGGRFGLLDPGGNAAGSVEVALRVTRYGSFILASFLLVQGKRGGGGGGFLFKNDARAKEKNEEEKEEEFRVGRADEEETEEEEEDLAESSIDLMQKIAGISASAGRILARNTPRKPSVIDNIEAPGAGRDAAHQDVEEDAPDGSGAKGNSEKDEEASGTKKRKKKK